MGILDGMQQQPAQEQPSMPPASDEPDPTQEQSQGQGASNVFSRLILAAATVLYTPAVTQSILEMIRKAPSPEAGLVQATVSVMSMLVEKSKGTVPDQVKTPIAKKVMALIAELAEAAGLVDDAAEATAQASRLMAQGLMQLAKGQGQQPPATQAPGAQTPQQAPAQPPAPPQPAQQEMPA